MKRITCVKVAVSAFLILTLACPLFAFGADSQTDAANAIASAKRSLLSNYTAVQATEKAGANVSALVESLNEVSSLLSNAELAYSKNDYSSATDLAIQSQTQLNSLTTEINAVKTSATSQGNQNFLVMLASVVGTGVVLSIGTAGWVYLNKKQQVQEAC